MALVCRNPFGGGGLCSLPARGEDADPPIAVCLSACLPHRNANVSLGPSSRRQTRGKDRQRNNSHKYRAHECLSGPLTARKRHPYRSRGFCLYVGLAQFYIYAKYHLSIVSFLLFFLLLLALTNKTKQGQRGTTKKGEPIMYDIENKINFAVFPGTQEYCSSSTNTTTGPPPAIGRCASTRFQLTAGVSQTGDTSRLHLRRYASLL